MRYLLAALLALAFVSPASAGPSFPALTGRVVDEAHLLSPTAKQNLEGELANLEARNGDQLVVVTVPSLDGQAIEDYGVALGRQWGIGQKGRNNGALLIVAVKEHRVRIEVGYGLEGTLTDATSSNIIQGVIVPRFKQQQMEQGITAGVQAIVTVLTGGTVPQQAAPLHYSTQHGTDSQGTEVVIVAILILIFLFSQIVFFTCYAVLWCIGSVLALFGSTGLLTYIRRLRDRIYPTDRALIAWLLTPSRNVYGRGGGRSGGFSSGSGGGFSGGGGSFGGGGSSGSW